MLLSRASSIVTREFLPRRGNALILDAVAPVTDVSGEKTGSSWAQLRRVGSHASILQFWRYSVYQNKTLKKHNIICHMLAKIPKCFFRSKGKKTQQIHLTCMDEKSQLTSIIEISGPSWSKPSVPLPQSYTPDGLEDFQASSESSAVMPSDGIPSGWI